MIRKIGWPLASDLFHYLLQLALMYQHQGMTKATVDLEANIPFVREMLDTNVFYRLQGMNLDPAALHMLEKIMD